MDKFLPNYIVGIGGSAGALNSYKALLDAMPSNIEMAFVVISHIHPEANSQLTKILSRHTTMPVLLAATGMPIQVNHVYVIPGKCRSSNWKFYLQDRHPTFQEKRANRFVL